MTKVVISLSGDTHNKGTSCLGEVIAEYIAALPNLELEFYVCAARTKEHSNACWERLKETREGKKLIGPSEEGKKDGKSLFG